jgi:hypothetical protein
MLGGRHGIDHAAESPGKRRERPEALSACRRLDPSQVPRPPASTRACGIASRFLAVETADQLGLVAELGLRTSTGATATRAAAY